MAGHFDGQKRYSLKVERYILHVHSCCLTRSTMTALFPVLFRRYRSPLSAYAYLASRQDHGSLFGSRFIKAKPKAA